MTDLMKDSKHLSDVRKDMIHDIARTSFELHLANMVNDSREAFERVVVEFRKMHSVMKEANARQYRIEAELRKREEEMRSLSWLSCDAYVATLLDDSTVAVSDMSDERFANLLEKIAKNTNPMKRATLAADGIRQIDDAVAGYKSKLAGIEARTSGSGTTDEERDVCLRKSLAVKEKLTALATRRKSLHVIFGNSRTAVARTFAKLESTINAK